MDASAHRHINTASDSELLLNIFANNLQQTGKFRINEEDIFTAIGGMMSQCKGAYACVAMLAGFGIIAFRDPNGIRPVGMAARKTISGTDYMFASESVVADAAGFVEWQDVKPGMFFFSSRMKVIFIVAQGKLSSSLVAVSPIAKWRGQLDLLRTYSSLFISRVLIPFWTESVSTGAGWLWVIC